MRKVLKRSLAIEDLNLTQNNQLNLNNTTNNNSNNSAISNNEAEKQEALSRSIIKGETGEGGEGVVADERKCPKVLGIPSSSPVGAVGEKEKEGESNVSSPGSNISAGAGNSKKKKLKYLYHDSTSSATSSTSSSNSNSINLNTSKDLSLCLINISQDSGYSGSGSSFNSSFNTSFSAHSHSFNHSILLTEQEAINENEESFESCKEQQDQSPSSQATTTEILQQQKCQQGQISIRLEEDVVEEELEEIEIQQQSSSDTLSLPEIDKLNLNYNNNSNRSSSCSRSTSTSNKNGDGGGGGINNKNNNNCTTTTYTSNSNNALEKEKILREFLIKTLNRSNKDRNLILKIEYELKNFIRRVISIMEENWTLFLLPENLNGKIDQESANGGGGNVTPALHEKNSEENQNFENLEIETDFREFSSSEEYINRKATPSPQLLLPLPKEDSSETDSNQNPDENLSSTPQPNSENKSSSPPPINFYKFPPNRTSYERMLIHRMSELFNLDHNYDRGEKTVIVNLKIQNFLIVENVIAESENAQNNAEEADGGGEKRDQDEEEENNEKFEEPLFDIEKLKESYEKIIQNVNFQDYSIAKQENVRKNNSPLQQHYHQQQQQQQQQQQNSLQNNNNNKSSISNNLRNLPTSSNNNKYYGAININYPGADLSQQPPPEIHLPQQQQNNFNSCDIINNTTINCSSSSSSFAYNNNVSGANNMYNNNKLMSSCSNNSGPSDPYQQAPFNSSSYYEATNNPLWSLIEIEEGNRDQILNILRSSVSGYNLFNSNLQDNSSNSSSNNTNNDPAGGAPLEKVVRFWVGFASTDIDSIPNGSPIIYFSKTGEREGHQGSSLDSNSSSSLDFPSSSSSFKYGPPSSKNIPELKLNLLTLNQDIIDPDFQQVYFHSKNNAFYRQFLHDKFRFNASAASYANAAAKFSTNNNNGGGGGIGGSSRGNFLSQQQQQQQQSNNNNAIVKKRKNLTFKNSSIFIPQQQQQQQPIHIQGQGQVQKRMTLSHQSSQEQQPQPQIVYLNEEQKAILMPISVSIRQPDLAPSDQLKPLTPQGYFDPSSMPHPMPQQMSQNPPQFVIQPPPVLQQPPVQGQSDQDFHHQQQPQIIYIHPNSSQTVNFVSPQQLPPGGPPPPPPQPQPIHFTPTTMDSNSTFMNNQYFGTTQVVPPNYFCYYYY